jgi:Family of unknown function (DUF6049)
VKRLLALAFPLIFVGAPAPAHAAAADPATTSISAARVVTVAHEETSGKPPLNVVFTQLPKYVRSSSTFTVQVQVVNPTQTAYSGVMGRLYYSRQSFLSRGSLDEYAQGLGFGPQSGGIALSKATTTIAPGKSATWTLKVHVKDLALPPGFGVYPLAVSVTDALGRTLASQRTFLVYCPNSQRSQPKTKIAWVWPIIDKPHRTNDTTFVDDQLAAEFAANGRLKTLVDAPRNQKTPVSWLVDPGLIDDASAMDQKDGYKVQEKSHPASAVATQWLLGLHQATAAPDTPTFLTPYADPDVMALTRAHRIDDIKTATTDGTQVAKEHPNVLNPATPMGLAMPPDGVADRQTLQQLVSNGSDSVLLSSANLVPANQSLTFTPDPRTAMRVGGRSVNGIAYDATLNQILGAGTHALGQSRLVEQRFLAETAMVADELPTVSRAVVAAPPQRWNPDPGFAKAVLADSSGVPWLKAVPLKTVESLKSTARTLTMPKDAVANELPPSYLDAVGQLSDRVSKFASILVHQPSGFQLGIPRSESSAWRSDTQSGVALRRQLSDQLTAEGRKVMVLDTQVSLAGRTGQIPLTIRNGLSQGTVTVELKVVANNPKQLVIGHFQGQRTISAGKIDPISIPVKSQANGVAVVTLELYGPDGEMFTDPTEMRVQTTAYGKTALIIIGASLAVLFLTVGVRIIRRSRNGHETEGTGA